MGTRQRIPFRRSQGQSLVEFCFCLPFLTLVLIAVIEFGQLYAVWYTTEQACFEGARLVASDNRYVDDSHDDEIGNRINAILSTVRAGLSASSVNITRAASMVTVEVVVDVPVFLPNITDSRAKVSDYTSRNFTIRTVHRAKM